MSASPETEGRSPKRQKSSQALTNGNNMSENVVDIVADGDVLLGLSGLAGMKKP